MKFDWKLVPLKRKLEWDLDMARGRLAVLQRSSTDGKSVLGALESMHADQSAAALAAAQRRADPAAHGQALSYLAGMEDRLARARMRCARAEVEVETARSDCKRCSERLRTLGALHDQAFAQFSHAVQREADKQADYAWIARTAQRERE